MTKSQSQWCFVSQSIHLIFLSSDEITSKKELKDPRKNRKRGVRRQCCFAGCNITDRDSEYVKLNVIKKKPKGNYLPDVVTTGSI